MSQAYGLQSEIRDWLDNYWECNTYATTVSHFNFICATFSTLTFSALPTLQTQYLKQLYNTNFEDSTVKNHLHLSSFHVNILISKKRGANTI